MTSGLQAEVVVVLERYFSRSELADLRVTAGAQGFSGANVWKVESSTAAFALRRWPTPGLPFDRLRGLHQLLQHLSNVGLSFVSAPVRSQTGETLLTVHNRYWQLEPWLPGVADFHADPTGQKLRSAMRTLALWHEVAAAFRPDADVRRWFGATPAAASPAVTERLARMRQLTSTSGERLRTAVRREADGTRSKLCIEMLVQILSSRDAVIRQLESLACEQFALQPCLRDIWHDHVLFTGDTVTGLIDPSACRMDNVAIDLARLLGSLVRDDANPWPTALDEYRRHHPLSLNEEALVVVLDQSGVLLSALTWLEWLYVERRPFPEAAKVDERLQWLHQRIRNLGS